MFDDITFIDVCDYNSSEGSYCVAVKDLSDDKFEEIESAMLEAADGTTLYDDIIREVMDESGLEYEIIYPERFISAD